MPSALSKSIFGAQYLQGRHHPYPLHLACFRAYASTRRLPGELQGSILGPWLAVAQVGVSPTRVCDIAESLLTALTNPAGSIQLIGSFSTYPYRFVSLPLNLIGSLLVHLPTSGS
jgi:hypothetical protein